MTTRIVHNAADRDLACKLIGGMKPPFVLQVTKGKRRSLDQNRLAFLWYREAADQLNDESADDKRRYCKLVFGVPILRMENEAFRSEYDRLIKGLPYQDKFSLMGEPIDLPVTRIMTTGQLSRYLDDVHRHYSDLGVQLTLPESIGAPNE